MAVIACPRCGAEMTDADVRCPNCGRLSTRMPGELLGLGLSVVMIVGLIAFVATR